MAKATVTYISGTRLARMNTKAGVRERTLGLQNARKSLSEAMPDAIVDAAMKNKMISANTPTADVQRAVSIIMQKTRGALLEVAAHIKSDMDKTPPLIPVDTGALRAAFKIIPKYKDPKNPKVELGWPDNKIEKTDPKTGKTKTVDQYAAYVHEMTSPPYGPINWSRAGSGAKFLEASVIRSIAIMPKIMKKHITI